MLQLIAFGSPLLVHDKLTLKSHTRRQRAIPLLLLIAAQGPRGLPRDFLAEMLWPDSEPARARHSLDETVSSIRQLPGCAGIFGTANPLALDMSVLTSDIWDFEAAVSQWQFERAVTICAGRLFAEGVSLDGANVLEQRLDGIRQRLLRQYVDALEKLADAARDANDSAKLVKWRRLQHELEPLGVAATENLVRALVLAKERTLARTVVLNHMTRVRLEGDEPDSAIHALLSELEAPALPGVAAAGTTRQSSQLADVTEKYTRTSERFIERLNRAIAPRFRADAALTEGSQLTSFAGTTTDHRGSHVEIHVVNSRAYRPEFLQHFLRSCGKVQALEDPRIVPMRAFGGDDELLWFVTPPRSATSLAHRLNVERPLPVADAGAIARDVAQALATAHTNGVVHGDLRPKFCELQGSDAAKLRFFGVMTALTADRPEMDQSTSVRMGSPVYQSPEQFAGLVTADARSDIYAYGSVVYEMLTGEPPFGKLRTPWELSQKVNGEIAPIRERRSSVPSHFAEVIERCLARIPADRFDSGAELVAALQ